MIKKLISFLICLIVLCSPAYAEGFASELEETEGFYVNNFNMFEKPKFSVPATRSGAKSNPGDIEGARAAMRAALLNYNDKCSFKSYKISVKTMIEIFQSLWYEEPELFYVNFSSGLMYGSLSWTNYDEGAGDLEKRQATTLYLAEDTSKEYPGVYRFTQEETRAKQQIIQKEYEEIISEISPDLSDVEKALAVHDYFALHYEYNYSAAESSYSNYPQAYAIDGLFIDKKAVCQGIALGYMYILGLLGIDSVFVPSNDMGHAWNLIKIGNNWYHVDVTWDMYDNQYAGWVLHDHFLLSDSAIGQRREHYTDYHHDWTADYQAFDTTYDDFFWKYITSGIFNEGGYWYYVSYNSEKQVDTICKRSIATGAENVIIELGDVWSYTDGYDDKIMPRSSKLFLHLSRIYYISPYIILSADLNGNDIKVECEPEIDEDEAYVCGLAKEGTTARYCVMQLQAGLQRYDFIYEDTFVLSRVSVSLDNDSYIITLDKSVQSGILFAAVYNDAGTVCVPVLAQSVGSAGTAGYEFNASAASGYTKLKVMIFDGLKPLVDPCAEFDLNNK